MEKTHLPAHVIRRRVLLGDEKHEVIFGESMGFIAPRLRFSYSLELTFSSNDVGLAEPFRNEIVV
jgi:hypothetical protein